MARIVAAVFILLMPLIAFSSNNTVIDNTLDTFSGDIEPIDEVPAEDGYALPGYYAYRYQLVPQWMTLGGSFRNRFEYMDGQFRRGLAAFDRQWPVRTRIFFSVHQRFDPIRFTFEYQDARAYLTRENSNVGPAHVNENELQQLHIDWYSNNFAESGLISDLQFGRVNMDLAKRRWIARNNFRNSTNAFDGLYWKLGADPDRLQARVFAVYPIDIQSDGLDPLFSDNTNFLWGAYVLLPEFKAVSRLQLELDYLHNHSQLRYRNFDMIGYRLFRNPEKGDWFFDFESQYQMGNISPRTRFGQFYHFSPGYSFNYRWNPQFKILFDYASAGFDTLYGSRTELAPSGILGPFQRSNLISGGFCLLLNPTENISFYVEQRFSFLQNPRFPWVGTGLWDPTGSSGRTLGSSTELQFEWLMLTNILMKAGYFYIDYGRFPKTAPFTPVTKNTNYVFAQLEIVF